MPVMNVNKVLYGVTRVLADNFLDTRIFAEEVPQDIDPPAFYVKLLSTEQTQDLGPRYWRYHSFNVHYYSPGYRNVDMQDVAEQLYDILRLIEIDGQLYRGTSLNHEIVDRVLHFFVDYNLMVREDLPDVPDMQTLDVEEGMK